jgi:predicted P-loop ATPase
VHGATATTASYLTWLQLNGVPALATTTVADAVRLVAERHKFDQLADFLNSLVWDGGERLSWWLELYLGADPSPLTTAIGRAWLISAVARGLEPGCQADHVLTLEGAQGVGKSTTARILGGEFTQEHLPDLHSKDAEAGLAGSWIVELSELAAMSRSEAESVKSVHYTPRSTATAPRTGGT